MTRFFVSIPRKIYNTQIKMLAGMECQEYLFQFTIQTYIMDLSMVIVGLEFIRSQIEQEHFTAKMVFNGNGALFFPVTCEHREHKATGISYEDDYRGNALAAMLSPGEE